MKFDYVLVGGGTSACVLANQILRKGLGTVAIIESGGFPRGPRIFTPVRYTETFNTAYDFGLETEPQRQLANRRIAYPRGRMLGGSSGINAMIYMPPIPDDMTDWPDGWTHTEIAPLVESIERQLFLEIDSQPEIHPLSRRFLDSVSEYNLANSSQRPIEPIRYRRTQRHGRRHAAYSAFLKPVIDNPQLTIIEKGDVTKVLFDASRATHVEFQYAGRTTTVEANVAVVLAAGTIFSPAILMRSGIGPREHLKENWIDARIDLGGVGKNLQDHLIVPIIYATSEKTSLEKIPTRSTRLEYVQGRCGPKASNIAEVGATISLDSENELSNPKLRQKHIQLHFTPTHYLEYPVRERPVDAWTIGVTHSNPGSCGEVRMAPKETAKQSVYVDPNYLSFDQDVESLIDGVNQSLLIADQPSLSDVRASMLLPRCSDGNQPDRNFIEKYIRRHALTLYHPIGTCAIGSDIQESVVDSQLCVRGTQNLFVADSSIIPRLPRGNPQSFAMVIGYRMGSILER